MAPSTRDLWLCFQQEVATLFKSVIEAACDTLVGLQVNVADFQANVKKRLKQLAGQYGPPSSSKYPGFWC